MIKVWFQVQRLNRKAFVEGKQGYLIQNLWSLNRWIVNSYEWIYNSILVRLSVFTFMNLIVTRLCYLVD